MRWGTSDQKLKKGSDIYRSNKDFINLIDDKFSVEKELLLALMGIETNLDIDKVLEIGAMNERIVGRRLRSEAIKNGRIPKSLTGR